MLLHIASSMNKPEKRCLISTAVEWSDPAFPNFSDDRAALTGSYSVRPDISSHETQLDKQSAHKNTMHKPIPQLVGVQTDGIRRPITGRQDPYLDGLGGSRGSHRARRRHLAKASRILWRPVPPNFAVGFFLTC